MPTTLKSSEYNKHLVLGISYAHCVNIHHCVNYADEFYIDIRDELAPTHLTKGGPFVRWVGPGDEARDERSLCRDGTKTRWQLQWMY